MITNFTFFSWFRIYLIFCFYHFLCRYLISCFFKTFFLTSVYIIYLFPNTKKKSQLTFTDEVIVDDHTVIYSCLQQERVCEKCMSLHLHNTSYQSRMLDNDTWSRIYLFITISRPLYLLYGQRIFSMWESEVNDMID